MAKHHYLELANFGGFSKRIDLASNGKGRKLEFDILWGDDGSTLERYFVTTESGAVYEYNRTQFEQALETYNVF